MKGQTVFGLVMIALAAGMAWYGFTEPPSVLRWTVALASLAPAALAFMALVPPSGRREDGREE